jgi:hypothetical protein
MWLLFSKPNDGVGYNDMIVLNTDHYRQVTQVKSGVCRLWHFDAKGEQDERNVTVVGCLGEMTERLRQCG